MIFDTKTYSTFPVLGDVEEILRCGRAKRGDVNHGRAHRRRNSLNNCTYQGTGAASGGAGEGNSTGPGSGEGDVPDSALRVLALASMA